MTIGHPSPPVIFLPLKYKRHLSYRQNATNIISCQIQRRGTHKTAWLTLHRILQLEKRKDLPEGQRHVTSLETCLLLRMSGLLSHSRGCVNILIEKGCEKKHGGHLKPKRYGRLGRILSWFQILFIEPHRFCFGGVLMFSRLCSREHRTQGCEVSLAYNHVFGCFVWIHKPRPHRKLWVLQNTDQSFQTLKTYGCKNKRKSLNTKRHLDLILFFLNKKICY